MKNTQPWQLRYLHLSNIYICNFTMLLVLSIKLKHTLWLAPRLLTDYSVFKDTTTALKCRFPTADYSRHAVQVREMLSTRPTSLVHLSGYLFCSQALWQGTTPSRSICPKNISAAPIISWTTRTQRNNTQPPQRWSAGLVCSEMPGGDQAAGTVHGRHK